MKIVGHAKYVGAMIGFDGYIHPWTHPEKIFQRVPKIFTSTKSLVERLCDLKIYAISVLDFIGMRIRQGNPQGREPSWCWALCVVLVLSCEWNHCSGPCRVCSARIRCPVDRLCRFLSQCQSHLDLLCDREHWFACFSLSLSSKGTASHTRNLRESRTRTIPDGQRSAARLSCEWISFCNGL